MMELDEAHDLLRAGYAEWIGVHEEHKLLFFTRARLVFLFNFHPTHSPFALRVGVPEALDYRVVLDSDRPEFGGHASVAPGQVYPLQRSPEHGRPQSIQVYLPARSCQVLAPVLPTVHP